MSAESDLHITIDRAAGLLLDATTAARSAARGRLPCTHRGVLERAIVALERAQSDLFIVRNDPWPAPRPKPRQLQLSLPAGPRRPAA